MVGGNPKHDAYGFRTWKHGNAMHEYYTTGTTGRFLGWWSVMLYAAFSVAGPDLIALAAGEMQNPRRNIPRVARQVFFRIVGFYVVGVLAVGIICSSRDPRLLGALDEGSVGSAASPWVIGITNLGIHGLSGFVNFLVMVSGWSCGNAYLYSSSRTLYSLALDGQAPRFFLKCTKSGVPIYCVLTVTLISCITFLVSNNASATVFGWFVDLATCAFLIVYTSMICTWVGWNRALKAQNVSRDSLIWKAPFMPWSAYIAIVTGLTVVLFLGFDCFSPFNIQGFLTSYFGIAYAIIMFLGWKIWKKKKFVKPSEADIWSGKAEIDRECEIWEGPDAPEPKTLIGRLWYRMW